MTWREYGDVLEERLLDLPRPRTEGSVPGGPGPAGGDPEAGRGVRLLGSASLEDKIVQRAVVDNILNPTYESEFCGFSYGFRPGRSAHDVLDALAYAVERRKVSWIVEVDIREFFDSIDVPFAGGRSEMPSRGSDSKRYARSCGPAFSSCTRGRMSDLPSLLKVGAVCSNGHVRICAGGTGQPAFLPRKLFELIPRDQRKTGRVHSRPVYCPRTAELTDGSIGYG